MSSRSSVARFVRQRSRLLKLFGYPLFALFAFFASLYYSLPRDHIRDRLERELSQESGPAPFGSGGFGIGLGMDVHISELDLHLLSPGLSVSGVQLRPRKVGLGSPISAVAGPPGSDKDGDKEKKNVKQLFIERIDVRSPLLELLSGNKVVDLEADAFGGTIRGVGGLNGDGMFVNGQIEQLILGRIANLSQALPLPMTGALSLTLNFKAPLLKPPPGAPPPRPGAPPAFDMQKASGVLEAQLKDGTLGDGKAKLVVPGDPFLSQGVTFPRLLLGTLGGRVVVDRGRATIDGLHTKSADAELWIEGYIDLREPMPASELHLYVRFLPSPNLVKREATIEILNNALSAGRRSDGSLGFAVTGSLGLPKSRPSKEPPDGVSVRGGTMGRVSGAGAPTLRPGSGVAGGSMATPAVVVSPPPSVPPRPRVDSLPPPSAPPPPPPSAPPPMAAPPPPMVAPPPPMVAPPPAAQEAPPPPPPPASSTTVVSPPAAQEAPPPSAPGATEGRPAERGGEQNADPPPSFPSHQRGF